MLNSYLYLIPKNIDPTDGSEIIQCKLSTRSERFHNLTIDEALLLIEKEKDQDDDIKEKHHNLRASLIEKKRNTVKAALETRATGKEAAKNRKKDKRSHQEIEDALIARKKARQAQKVLNEDTNTEKEQESNIQAEENVIQKTNIRRHLIKGVKK